MVPMGRGSRTRTSGSPDEVTVAVRVRPGASRTKVGGHYHGRYGPSLVVAVTAPPVGGRATEAARQALAAELGVSAHQVSLRGGATSRDKLFAVSAPPADLLDRVRALRGGDA
jgi:uncharacterized protein YggU (UPF0235/DUF167 family)